jgi:hypothetical protein
MLVGTDIEPIAFGPLASIVVFLRSGNIGVRLKSCTTESAKSERLSG